MKISEIFCFKDRALLFFLAAGNKKFQRANATAIRVCYAYDANDANESPRRLVKDGMSSGLTNTHTGSWILCSVSRVRLKTMHSLFCITS